MDVGVLVMVHVGVIVHVLVGVLPRPKGTHEPDPLAGVPLGIGVEH